MFKIDVPFNVKIISNRQTFSNIQFWTFVKNIAFTSKRDNTEATLQGNKPAVHLHTVFTFNKCDDINHSYFNCSIIHKVITGHFYKQAIDS